ncbi:hypothetical protein SMACR_12122 [Sordaria macrospora]|uniref:WGS project CABT00000000 data, contig 2.20 n=2 Tax=Sordaria macrospora TaxID=5147 RepID=F7W1R7_SORMK|nr:uncharacterized protein SMAC_12122 [Sordaria macrospora k-hell]KAA8630740.1 hypothetical protein SMACR_12122 [Sordaria macrospora]KAH7631429.1 hypothetical protein B0T09DRAFT_261168 [Sordaria sp. MPI-SDFR-AT-0083]WPJ62760.1 hypothetical protein SMAC4_12122 [Sordaria macrospora]CCC11552.1 unnamed protein product [Sordaria macrospora k-hell]
MMTTFTYLLLLLLLGLVMTCAAIPAAYDSSGFSNYTLSLAQLSAQKALCSCDDTPCPEKKTVCMNGACTCIHHEGCRADSDCEQYHVPCPHGQSMMCQQMDPFWRNNVCICVTEPDGDYCKQVLTHCPYATTPYCSLDDEEKFPNGEVTCLDDEYLQCKEPEKCKCWT